MYYLSLGFPSLKQIMTQYAGCELNVFQLSSGDNNNNQVKVEILRYKRKLLQQ